jgi:hypothetical protein
MSIRFLSLGGRRFPVLQRAILNAGFTPCGGRLPAY